ncbi:hypothetical protein QF035_000071 [Streptomyces umbrinus]|uniref:Integral membrane protein n=1 Tax=Streptomyces umbrinus TaxID=67370 RepID=A0ABU0SG15_9ACTN|nr:hypothetical protein [Streptomyces umbrinus]
MLTANAELPASPVHTSAVKMTETFAATIAAVAPVIWLVAAVEWSQYIKRWEGTQAFGASLRRARRLAETVEGRTGGARVQEILSILDEGRRSLPESPSVEPPAKRRTAFAYLCVASLLLTAEGFSLVWLASSQKAEPVTAWFCLTSVMVGFFAVMLLPAVASYAVSTYGSDQRKQDMDWLTEFARQEQALETDASSPPES